MMATSVSWTALQIAEAIRDADRLLHPAFIALSTTTDTMGGDERATLDASDVEALHATAEQLGEAVEQLQALTRALPEGSFNISYANLRDGAAKDLAHGIIDPRRALLAASVLDVRAGWGALATALSSTDTASAWEDVTLEQMLSRFRGVTRRLARRAIRQAGLVPDLPFAVCSVDGLARLAAVLERAATAAS